MYCRVSMRTALVLGGMSLWSLPGFAQIGAPPPPTTQQAIDADQRTGNFFQFNGANIFYQVAGQGTPLILIHGYPLSGDLFRGQLAGLSSKFQVITLDLPGFGKSTAPDATGSIAGYAQYVLALMDQLGIQTAVIGGHSMGGQITLELFKEAPQRFSGMILIDTNPAAASIVEQAEFPAFGKQASQLGVPSIVPILAPQMVTGATLQHNDQLATGIMNILAEGSVNGAVAGGTALATRPDYTAMPSSINVPTLVVVGVTTRFMGFRSRRRPRAKFPMPSLRSFRLPRMPAYLNGLGWLMRLSPPGQASKCRSFRSVRPCTLQAERI